VIPLPNAAKHGGATEAHVILTATPKEIVVEIRDNGSGGAELARGTGLRGLADRVEALGGRFEVQSPEPAGTVIRAEVPLH